MSLHFSSDVHTKHLRLWGITVWGGRWSPWHDVAELPVLKLVEAAAHWLYREE